MIWHTHGLPAGRGSSRVIATQHNTLRIRPFAVVRFSCMLAILLHVAALFTQTAHSLYLHVVVLPYPPPYPLPPFSLPLPTGNSVYTYLSSCRSTHFDANALICFYFSALREFALISFCYFAIYLSPPLSVCLSVSIFPSLHCSRPGKQAGREICADVAYIYRRLHLSCQKSLTKLNLLPPVALSFSLSLSLSLSVSLTFFLSLRACLLCLRLPLPHCLFFFPACVSMFSPLAVIAGKHTHTMYSLPIHVRSSPNKAKAKAIANCESKNSVRLVLMISRYA